MERLCEISNPSGCSAKEAEFISKAKAMDAASATTQLTRLEAMKGNKMTADLKAWLMQRISILKQVVNREEL